MTSDRCMARVPYANAIACARVESGAVTRPDSDAFVPVILHGEFFAVYDDGYAAAAPRSLGLLGGMNERVQVPDRIRGAKIRRIIRLAVLVCIDATHESFNKREARGRGGCRGRLHQFCTGSVFYFFLK